MEKTLVIGLMSGTSADGVDAALIETDGGAHVRPLAFVTLPYTPNERAAILAAYQAAREMDAPAPQPLILQAERMLTLKHAQAARALPGGDAATLIGFHGQTVAHRPDRGWTWQAGDAALLAQLTGRPVACDFRGADVAAGGQGAPLAPGYHRARLVADGPAGVLNIGGVANLTWFAGADWGAFDTGPGNAPIDDWVFRHTGRSFDADGAIAGRGRVRDDVLTALLDNDWFDLGGAKSLDRDDFSAAPARGLPLEDGAATLTAFTAEAVALSLRRLPTRLDRLWVTGGGRRNPTLMAMLAARCGVAVQPVEALGWNGDALEAEAFGWLAVRVLRGLPLSWPETTGVPAPTPGGRIAEPPR